MNPQGAHPKPLPLLCSIPKKKKSLEFWIPSIIFSLFFPFEAPNQAGKVGKKLPEFSFSSGANSGNSGASHGNSRGNPAGEAGTAPGSASQGNSSRDIKFLVFLEQNPLGWNSVEELGRVWEFRSSGWDRSLDFPWGFFPRFNLGIRSVFLEFQREAAGKFGNKRHEEEFSMEADP